MKVLRKIFMEALSIVEKSTLLPFQWVGDAVSLVPARQVSDVRFVDDGIDRGT